MKKREFINKLVSVMAIVSLIMPIASQAYAADPIKGIEVKADRTELDKAVKEAKDSGLDITEDSVVDKGSVGSNAEANAKLAEIDADYKAQIKKLKKQKLNWMSIMLKKQNTIRKKHNMIKI